MNKDDKWNLFHGTFGRTPLNPINSNANRSTPKNYSKNIIVKRKETKQSSNSSWNELDSSFLRTEKYEIDANETSDEDENATNQASAGKLQISQQNINDECTIKRPRYNNSNLTSNSAEINQIPESGQSSTSFNLTIDSTNQLPESSQITESLKLVIKAQQCSESKSGRRKPKSGGLVEKLQQTLRQSKSNQSFWHHERMTGRRDVTYLAEITKIEIIYGVIVLYSIINGQKVICFLNNCNSNLCGRILVGRTIEINLIGPKYQFQEFIVYPYIDQIIVK